MKDSETGDVYVNGRQHPGIRTKEDFKNWTQSASFREAHSGGPPDFILGGELANYEVKLSSENY